MTRFPAFNVEKKTDQLQKKRDHACLDCEAVFSSQKDCDLHNQSRFCPGSAAVAFVLYRDSTQQGGYRVDKKHLPFNSQSSSIKCSKCPLAFSNRLVKKVHERTHPAPRLECLHCKKPFSTMAQLDSHYEWHDDMEHRHHRDKCRRKLPGLKLQSTSATKRLSKIGIADFGRKSVFLADDDMGPISEEMSPDGDPGKRGLSGGTLSDPVVVSMESTKELVAISLVSAEDLERVYAPNGVFREVELTSPQTKEVREDHLNSALDALEGKSESSLGTLNSFDRSSVERTATSDDLRLQPGDIKKRASIREFFRRTKSEDQLESSEYLVSR